MKVYRILILLVLCSFQEVSGIELKENAQEAIPKDWIIFVTKKSLVFSESFKKRMAADLYPQIYAMLDNKIPEDEFGFSLLVGAVDLQMMEKDKHVFIIAQFNSPNQNNYYVTVAWTSPDFKNSMDIHKSDISAKDVKFSWCADFPKDKIIKDCEPIKAVLKSDTGLRFDALYYIHAFPDLIMFFDFDGTPGDSTLKAIDKELKDYSDSFKTIAAFDITFYENQYLVFGHYIFDYTNYSGEDFEKEWDKTEVLLYNINRNSAIKNLRRIRFR